MKEKYRPAFPKSDCKMYAAHLGMSMLEWYAGLAMQSLILVSVTKGLTDEDVPEEHSMADIVASQSIAIANAMLKALESDNKNTSS